MIKNAIYTVMIIVCTVVAMRNGSVSAAPLNPSDSVSALASQINSATQSEIQTLLGSIPVKKASDIVKLLPTNDAKNFVDAASGVLSNSNLSQVIQGYSQVASSISEITNVIDGVAGKISSSELATIVGDIKDLGSINIGQVGDVLSGLEALGSINVGDITNVIGDLKVIGSINVGDITNIVGNIKNLGSLNIAQIGQVLGDLKVANILNIGELSNIFDGMKVLGDINLGEIGNIIDGLKGLGSLNIGEIGDLIGNLKGLGSLNLGEIGNLIDGLKGLGSLNIGEIGNLLGGLSDLGSLNLSELGSVLGNLGSLGSLNIGELGQVLGDLKNLGSLNLASMSDILSDLASINVLDFANIGQISNLIGNLGANFQDIGNLIGNLTNLGNINIGQIGDILGNLNLNGLANVADIGQALNALSLGGILNATQLSAVVGDIAALTSLTPAEINAAIAAAGSGTGTSICCSCRGTAGKTSKDEWKQTTKDLKAHLDDEFHSQETYMIRGVLDTYVLPAMMLMAEQLTVVATQQVQIFGMFYDAKHQLESQQEIQKRQARIHKNYHPSIGMCEFGSNVRSLAESERKGEVVAATLSQRNLDRQIGATYSSASGGYGFDKAARIEQFKADYCDPWEQGNGLWLLCRGVSSKSLYFTPSPAGTDAERDRFNKDVDFGRALDFPWTLDVDFTDTNLTDDEADVFALSSYLYAHEVFARASPQLLRTPITNRLDASLTDMQKAYLDLRAMTAKRDVAMDSFGSIVGLKSAGDPGSRDHIVAILQNSGLTDINDINEFLGDNPSYDTQMETITKTIYQNPTFYTNLYDKPANVTRKAVAMQAIGLMQKFDMFKSQLRQEATMSVLLEMSIEELQNKIEADIFKTGQ